MAEVRARVPVRRPPPDFRRVVVRAVESLGPRMVRLTLAGPELAGFPVPEPAASVRLLVPSPGGRELVMPAWTGNEFLLPDGSRPSIRTFTPRRFEPDEAELDVDIVLHGAGRVSTWAAQAVEGDPAAVSGPARGWRIDGGASGFVLAGDETALPAIGQLLECLPQDRPVRVLAEVAQPDGRVALPVHPGAEVEWLDLPDGAAPGHALVAAVQQTPLEPGARLWAAGEAAAMQRIRRHLFEDRGLSRAEVTVRGYWKHGRAGDTEGAEEP